MAKHPRPLATQTPNPFPWYVSSARALLAISASSPQAHYAQNLPFRPNGDLAEARQSGGVLSKALDSSIFPALARSAADGLAGNSAIDCGLEDGLAYGVGREEGDTQNLK